MKRKDDRLNQSEIELQPEVAFMELELQTETQKNGSKRK